MGKHMPKGGYKHGGGRPLGSVAKVRELTEEGLKSEQGRRKGMTPLEYMLDVMGDSAVDPIRRDRMAVAAAPYVHPKADLVAHGKKQAAEEEARTNDLGTEWAALLHRAPGHSEKQGDTRN